MDTRGPRAPPIVRGQSGRQSFNNGNSWSATSVNTRGADAGVGKGMSTVGDMNSGAGGPSQFQRAGDQVNSNL